MNDDDPLIQRLKQLDAQHQASQPIAVRSLVQSVVHASALRQSGRRARRRSAAIVLTTSCCIGLVAGWSIWQRPQRGQQPIAVAEPTPPLAPTDPELIATDGTIEPLDVPPLDTSMQSVDSRSQVESLAERHSREQAEELERLVAEHAHLQQRLQELETQILRAELSQRVMDEMQIPSDVFY